MDMVINGGGVSQDAAKELADILATAAKALADKASEAQEDEASEPLLSEGARLMISHSEYERNRGCFCGKGKFVLSIEGDKQSPQDYEFVFYMLQKLCNEVNGEGEKD